MSLAAVVHGMEPRANQTPLLKPDRKVSTVDLFLLFQPWSLSNLPDPHAPNYAPAEALIITALPKYWDVSIY